MDKDFLAKWHSLLKAQNDSEKEAAWRNLLEPYGETLDEDVMDALMGRD